MDAERLIALEAKYAPAVEQGRGVFSPKDKNPHAPWNLGGDKMAADRNNYAHVYAALLKDLDPQLVVELGVFRGVSLAMWCDLFPEAMVVGLDLDFERFKEHRPTLVSRGAFTYHQPLLHEWDAYGDDTDFLADLPGIDLFVDDGPHTADAIRNTARLIGPLMNPGGVYVVEDFPGGGDILADFFPAAQIIYSGRISAARL
ncbi:MAG TPA: class I SAM-dependent methyltransferase [Acidimicrobiia bacterium]